MNNASRSTFSLYLIGRDIQAQLTQDRIVLITPLVLGLSSSCVTVSSSREQHPLVSTPQYWSGSHNIIFVDELQVHFACTCFIKHFREMLLKCDNKVIDMHNASFSYGGEMEVYWEPWVVTQTKDNVGYSP